MVTGGAGYIGAHVVRMLQQRGDVVLVVDDLSAGRRERVAGAEVLQLDLTAPGAADALTSGLRELGCEAVFHLAARKSVAESVARPLRYYRENVGGLLTVLEAVRSAGVGRLVFSSTAAVYGTAGPGLVGEDAPTAPVNPYGRTKLACEWLLRDAEAAWGLRQVSLRFFNVAGAGWPDLGDPSTENLVTGVLHRWGRGLPALVHGHDYPTPDGTCIRDYVHVTDLAAAHLAALTMLDQHGRGHDVLNIGTGQGASVLEVVDALDRASGGRGAGVVLGPRRPGDPDAVVADAARAARVLGWQPREGLEEIARSAWTAWTAPDAPRGTPGVSA